jgi:hypothetical protein
MQPPTACLPSCASQVAHRTGSSTDWSMHDRPQNSESYLLEVGSIAHTVLSHIGLQVAQVVAAPGHVEGDVHHILVHPPAAAQSQGKR